MQIAVATNLHGNLLALEEILSKVEKLNKNGKNVKRIYLLGILGFLPYPNEVFKLISESDTIFATMGKYDHIIARWGEIDEEKREDLREQFPEFVLEVLEWNWKVLGREGREWLKNDIPPYITENFRSNEFFFVYGDPFNPVDGEIQPARSTTYYEQLLSQFKKFKNYDVIVVAGRKSYVVETNYGKLICPGSAGMQSIKGSEPIFTVIDTKTTNMEFFKFEFDRTEIERKIRKAELPEQLIELLYHGYL